MVRAPPTASSSTGRAALRRNNSRPAAGTPWATTDVVEGWRTARAAWPGVHVGEEEFAAYVRDRAAAALAAGAEPHFADLYLACGCARGDGPALRSFEGAFFSEVDRAVAKVGGAVPSAAELRQVLHERLFVAAPGRKPRIVEYTGRGQLRVWFRIAATRTAINLATSAAAKELPADADDLMSLLGAGADPELSYLKRQYTDLFKAALREAFTELATRERNLLRYAFRHGLTVDAIGAVYGVHRATAARWVVDAHTRLAGGLRRRLVSTLGIRNEEYASILRLIESRLEITLDRYLAESTPPPSVP